VSVADVHGLTEEEALARLASQGPNVLPQRARRSTVRLVGDVLREPMLLLLLAAGTIYLLLGDLVDALVLLAFASFSVLLSVVQGARADRAIEALSELARPQACVIRDGQQRSIPAAGIVCGDLLVIGEGDRLVADGWLVSANRLRTDESVLTGESVPVDKVSLDGAIDARPAPQPGGDGLAYAFSGTMVVRGSGLVSVAATGSRTRIGQIGQALAGISTEAPRLAVETRGLIRVAAGLGLLASVIATILYGLLRGGWLDAILSGIALSMSLLPEELPVVLALFLTMGAIRMSRARVLARRGAAIESLGATTVLCTDKTGTLTLNRMAIAELRLPGGRRFVPVQEGPLALPLEFVELAGLGVLASLQQPFDPMETAFHDLASRHGESEVNWRQERGWTLHRHYPLAPDLLAMSHVWSDGERRVIAAKGAPEAIAELCGLDSAERAALEKEVGDMASRGLRVLGIAETQWNDPVLPESQREFDYAYRGLVGLADPIRANVPSAVAELQRAGVRVVLITGDYPLTAAAIAQQAGIRMTGMMTGSELAALTAPALRDRVGKVSVFARVMAEQKLLIVEALKARGEIAAMVGDGVNDAPSLKAAHIGVAMGKRGTDVAREAAAIVLLDDDFASIPVAVRLGRRIFDNLRKASGFIFAVHFPIAVLALAPLVLGWPLILGPMHIAVLEMIIDPVCALAFEAEPEEPDIMTRPPRAPQAPLLPRRVLAWSLVEGSIAAGLLLGVGAWAFLASGLSVPEARGTVFVGLFLAILVLIAGNRSLRGFSLRTLVRPSLQLGLILLAGASFVAVAFSVPMLAHALGFASLPAGAYVIAALSAAGLVGSLAVLKRRFGPGLAR